MQMRICLSRLTTVAILSLLYCNVAADILIAERTTYPAPIVLAASQDWDGNDGPWSSFPIQVGSPAQTLKVLISTSSWTTSLVVPQGCVSNDTTCAASRGNTFNLTDSTTWEFNTANLSSYVYPLDFETSLGYQNVAEMGFDTITLGWQGSGGPTLKNQTMGGFTTTESYMGLFGLCPRASNFTSFADPIPSFVQNLVNQSLIPGTSWAYTAGNQYRLNAVLGSLIFGGYDTARFDQNTTLSFPFDSVNIRDLTAQLSSITTNGTLTSGASKSLLPTSIPVFLDSSLPYFWLPDSACALFEAAFNLEWDNTTSLYLINTTHHTQLTTLNPSVTLTFTSSSSTTLTGSKSINITLPYSAFSLTASTALVSSTSYYFPLKRAANSTQYVLGRTFFQEAYVIADYDRGNFSVSACSWDSGTLTQSIVSILPPSSSSSGSGSGNGTTTAGKSTSSALVGAIAGGIVAGAVVVGIIALVLFHRHVRRIPFLATKLHLPGKTPAELHGESAAPPPGIDDPYTGVVKPELDSTAATQKPELAAADVLLKPELDAAERERAEMEGSRKPGELVGTEGAPMVESDARERYVFEMPAREEVAAELRGIESGRDVPEMESPPAVSELGGEGGEGGRGRGRGGIARFSWEQGGWEVSPESGGGAGRGRGGEGGMI